MNRDRDSGEDWIMAEEDKKEEKQEYEPNLITVFGKTFDVNDPTQKAQLSTWEEAFRSMQGKQSNELGELRKFHSKLSPILNKDELKTKVRELEEQGNTEDTVELLFASQAKMLADFEERLKAEKHNDKLWNKYLSKRPELLKAFDEDIIRSYSEKELGILDADDPFKALDQYWLPKAQAKIEFDTAEPVDTKSTADVTKVTRPVSEPKKEEPPVKTLDDIFGPIKY